LNAVSEAVQTHSLQEKNAQNAIEDSRELFLERRAEGGAPPLQGGSYVAFKAPGFIEAVHID
jgi:hypothetical protein